MFKRYVDHLHPRIETLLVYHKRPLDLLFKPNQAIPTHIKTSIDKIPIRYTHHPFCQELITLLGRPILSMELLNEQQNPITQYTQIPTELKNQCYYSPFKVSREESSMLSSVLAEFNEEGELNIIRG